MFSDMSLEAIAHQLERWYDVEICFDDGGEILSLYRVMKRYNELEQVLGLIERRLMSGSRWRTTGESIS